MKKKTFGTSIETVFQFSRHIRTFMYTVPAYGKNKGPYRTAVAPPPKPKG